jgi:hypothetical protein
MENLIISIALYIIVIALIYAPNPTDSSFATDYVNYFPPVSDEFLVRSAISEVRPTQVMSSGSCDGFYFVNAPGLTDEPLQKLEAQNDD